jgi:hypothetical protein
MQSAWMASTASSPSPVRRLPWWRPPLPAGRRRSGNIGASIQLHGITALIAVDHGNCGALGIAYGQRVLDDPKLELAAHLADAQKLKEELAIRHPDLDYQAWFVDRDSNGRFNKWKTLAAGPEIN